MCTLRSPLAVSPSPLRAAPFPNDATAAGTTRCVGPRASQAVGTHSAAFATVERCHAPPP